MSVRAVQWALETSVGDATAKLVLLALADEADSDGLCWPFMRRLAARAEVSEKTVSRKIAFLTDAGLLEKTRKRRRSGRLSGYSYQLALTPADTLSGGEGPAFEDAAGAPEADVPSSHGQHGGAGATRADEEATPATAAPHAAADGRMTAREAPTPPDRMSPGPADSVSSGPPDTAVSPGPPDTQVSGGKDLDPPSTDPPPPPTPSSGGGGSAAAGRRARPLVAGVAALFDDERKQLRLLTEATHNLDALEDVLRQRTADGWPPDALAAQLTDGSFDRVASLAGVLRGRAERLAGVEPPRSRRRDADGIPSDVLTDLKRRAADDAITDDGSVDPDLRRRRLDELAAAWLAEHKAQEVGAR